MSDTDSVIDRLYTSYLLRDFVAKVVPGALLLFSLAISTGATTLALALAQQLPFWAWVLVIGLAFSIGFVVQAIGEFVGWTRIYPGASSHNAPARANAIRRMIELSSSSQPWVIQQRERYVVLKEMSANFSLSLTLSAVLIAVPRLAPPLPALSRLILLLLAIVSFFWYNRLTVRDQRTLEEAAAPPAAPEPAPRGKRRGGA